MAAEIGNNYAEKWTSEVINSLLDKLLAYSKDCLFLGKVLCDNDISRQTWDYLQERFKDDRHVIDTVKRIEQITETNLLNSALSGKVKETMAIFLLKCKYGYIDKQQIEIEHKGTVNINLTLPDNNTGLIQSV